MVIDLDSLAEINADEFNAALMRKNKDWFKMVCNNSLKLRTYRLFKYDNEPERYLSMFLTRSYRSKLAQFRLGVFPIRIETGRYVKEKPNERLCVLCNTNNIEDEKHFLVVCENYSKDRDKLYAKVRDKMPMFDVLNNDEKFVILLREFPRQTACFLYNAYLKRRQAFYK
jgi:hypothetical protein